MLVNGDSQTFFRFVLTDYIFVEKILDILRLWQVGANGGRLGSFVVMNDLIAYINALITNINAGSGDQFSNIVLRLAAKRAAEQFFWSPEVCHTKIADDSGRSESFEPLPTYPKS